MVAEVSKMSTVSMMDQICDDVLEIKQGEIVWTCDQRSDRE